MRILCGAAILKCIISASLILSLSLFFCPEWLSGCSMKGQDEVTKEGKGMNDRPLINPNLSVASTWNSPLTVSCLVSSAKLPDALFFFFFERVVGGLSSYFCGSLPPTSAYSISFPLLQGVMWITVGRNQELWKTCSKWTSPLWCRLPCPVPRLGPVGAVPFYAAKNCSGLKFEWRKEGLLHCATSQSIWWLSELECTQRNRTQHEEWFMFCNWYECRFIKVNRCWWRCLHSSKFIFLHCIQDNKSAQLKVVWNAIQYDSAQRRGERFIVSRVMVDPWEI